MLLFVPGLLIGITAHEFAHAWSAGLLGDHLPRRMGRVSLNPLRHLSPLGTLCMFVLPFGWGKPVLVNLYNFKRPRRDYLLTSLAGPAMNVLLVALCILLMQVTRHSFAFPSVGERTVERLHVTFLFAAISNSVLAAFNLIPLPPLDGSKIWPALFRRVKPAFSPSMNRFYLVVMVVLLSTHALRPAIRGVVGTTQAMLPASDFERYGIACGAGLEAFKANQLAAAEARFTEAAAWNPRPAEALVMRAWTRKAQGNFEGAQSDMAQAVRFAPEKYGVLQKQLDQRIKDVRDGAPREAD